MRASGCADAPVQSAVALWHRHDGRGGKGFWGFSGSSGAALLAAAAHLPPPATETAPTSPFPPTRAIPISSTWTPWPPTACWSPGKYRTIDWQSTPDRVNYGALYQKRVGGAAQGLRPPAAESPRRLRRFLRGQRLLAARLRLVHGAEGRARRPCLEPVGTGAAPPGPRRPGRRPHPLRRGHRLLAGGAVSLFHPMAGPEGLRQRPRHPHHRGPAHLCSRRQRGCVEHAGSLPAGRRPAAHRGGRLPAGRFFRHRPAVGQPAVRLGRHAPGTALPGGVRRIRVLCAAPTMCCASTTSAEFAGYYAIPYGQTDACGGRWRPGPGIDLFRAVEKSLGRLPILAEDLGFLTDDVRGTCCGQSGSPA